MLFSVFTITSCTKQDEQSATSIQETKKTNQIPKKSYEIPSTDPEICGNALAGVLTAISILNEDQTCEFRNIANNNNLTTLQKDSAIRNVVILEDFVTTLDDLSAIAQAHGIESYDGDNASIEVMTFQILYNFGFDPNDFDDSRPNVNPCAAYNAALWGCAANFASCCVGASAATGPLAPVAWALCGAGAYFCVEGADAAYPGCVGKGGSAAMPVNPFLTSSSTTCF